MARGTLRAGTLALALRLQESMDSGDSLSAGEVSQRLRDSISDAHRGTGTWAYYIDHYGDGESGVVIYSCSDDTKRAPYEISSGNGVQKCIIDFENSEDVIPHVVYQVEQDEADHIAAMESLRADELYGETVPAYERFIPRSTRDKASASDFAGKGKSFPILKAEDVAAAASSLGRAGSGNYDTATIKANIIRIAKRKGFPLPKAWQKDGGSESADPVDLGDLATRLSEAGARNSAEDLRMLQSIHDTANKLGAACPDTFRMVGTESAASQPINLVESAATLETIVLREARADYEIKLIAPGKGSSAFYPAEVLKRDGPKVFRANTHIYLNHPTAAEEAARPEGDVANLAGVLTTDAAYHESHAKGPGLYARMKVFADHAQMVEEKAAHVGMSIRASGIAESGKQQDGLPILKKLTAAESVDVVTRAGAGGMILTESAAAAATTQPTVVVGESQTQTQQQQEVGMDADELKALKESHARLMERAVFQDARETARTILADMSLHEAAKVMVIENVIGTDGAWKHIPRKDGALDSEKFRAMITSESQRIGRMLHAAGALGSGQVTGMGVSVIEAPRAEEIAAREAQRQREDADALEIFESLMGKGSEAAKLAAKGRAA